jgi:hypothetical protein
LIYYPLNIKEKKKNIQGLILDFYQAQNKYRQKQFRSILNYIFKLIMIVVAVFIGWWLGNSDKLVLIQENEKIINDFNDQKIELDRKLTDIRLKLKEANLALNTQNIKNKDTDFGRDAKNILASYLAKGVPEKDIIDALRLLGYNKTCSKFDYKELAVSTQSFIPPENTLLLLSGGLKIKVEGNISDKVNDIPYFDPSQPIRVIFIYLGNNDIVEGNLPITKNIMAGKFSVKIKILKSKVRGAVIVQYQNCKI